MNGGAARPLKILHVLDSLGMGGAETWLMALLRHWRAQGQAAPQMDFLLTGGKETVFDAEARAGGAKTFYLRYGLTNLVPFATGYRRLLREGRYDVIHDHADYASGWHYLLGAGVLPRARVTHVHNPIFQAANNYGVSPRRRMTARAGKKLVARFATHIAATSRDALAAHGFEDAAFSAIPSATAYCGFDPAPFRGPAERRRLREEFGWPQNAKIILFVGRIDRSVDPADPQTHKNSAFAVAVAMECARRDEAVRAIFAGAPSPASIVLEEKIAAAGFAGRIRLAGVRRDIPALMLAADVLLFPSRGEGLGMAVVEAQAAGLPVLASDAVPAEAVVIPELVRFLPIAAGEKKWAAALLELAQGPRDVEGANRQIAHSQFSISESARQLLKIYADASRR